MSDQPPSAHLAWLRLTPFADQRGESYSLPAAALAFLKAAREAHVATVVPGAVRGNHAHPRHRETLAVLSRDAWRLTWESLDGKRHVAEFAESGAVVIQIGEGVPHAVRNIGGEPLVIVSVSDRVGQDPSDTTRHRIE